MSRQPFFDEHREVSRRYFLRQSMELGGGVGALGLGAGGVQAAAESEAVAKARAALDAQIKGLEYLTEPDKFGPGERGNPLPYKLPPEKLKSAGMTRESWRLEVLPDPGSNSRASVPCGSPTEPR